MFWLRNKKLIFSYTLLSGGQAKGLSFGLSSSIILLLVCVSSEGSGKTVKIGMQVITALQCVIYQNKMAHQASR